MSCRESGQTLAAASVSMSVDSAEVVARSQSAGTEQRLTGAVIGRAMATYVDSILLCWYVTFMSNPAISVPAGFTSTGLPVGAQIAGRHRDDWSVLQLAYAFEQATRHGQRRPAL